MTMFGFKKKESLAELQNINMHRKIVEMQVLLHEMDEVLHHTVNYIDDMEYKLTGESRRILFCELQQKGFLK